MINAINGGGSRTILLSKRANIFYLDRAKVSVFNERVIYKKDNEENILDYNIPDCNTSLLLLGQGTSITNSACRALSKSGVVIGFCGTGGTPLHCADDFTFFNPADEYRPTQYAQKFIEIWFDENKRFEKAKKMQFMRLNKIEKFYNNKNIDIKEITTKFKKQLNESKNINNLLTAEAIFIKMIYKTLAEIFKIENYTKKSDIKVNQFLLHGNYLMYGLGAVATHALGIPNCFALLHGKTRRGGLIFDIADLYKALNNLYLSFEMGVEPKTTDSDFRKIMINTMIKEEVLDSMIEDIKILLEIK